VLQFSEPAHTPKILNRGLKNQKPGPRTNRRLDPRKLQILEPLPDRPLSRLLVQWERHHMAPRAVQQVRRIPIVCRPALQVDKACLQTDRWKAGPATRPAHLPERDLPTIDRHPRNAGRWRNQPVDGRQLLERAWRLGPIQKCQELGRFLRDLIERTLLRRLVGTPTYKTCAMAEAAAGKMIVTHLHH